MLGLDESIQLLANLCLGTSPVTRHNEPHHDLTERPVGHVA